MPEFSHTSEGHMKVSNPTENLFVLIRRRYFRRVVVVFSFGPKEEERTHTQKDVTLVSKSSLEATGRTAWTASSFR